MKKLMTSMDQHGRILIPAEIRTEFNIHPGDQIILSIEHNELKIINTNQIIDDMHAIFTKNKGTKS